MYSRYQYNFPRKIYSLEMLFDDSLRKSDASLENHQVGVDIGNNYTHDMRNKCTLFCVKLLYWVPFYLHMYVFL